MNCMEVQELMELYYNGELDEKTMDKIDEHLEHCESCLNYYNYLEDTISDIKDMYKSIELPVELNDIDALIPKKPVKKKSTLKKVAAVASIILIAGVLANSTALADTIKKIAYPEWVSKIAGESVTHSLDNGFGQRVELSDTKTGITMTVHNVIIEEDKTRVIFSISGISSVDNISIGHISLKDKKGKVLVNGGGWGCNYNDKEGKLYVSYEGKKINKNLDELTFEVSDVKLLNNRKKEFDYSLSNSSASDIKLNLESKVYKNVIFKSFEQVANKLMVKYNVEFYNKKDNGSLTPYLDLIGGEKAMTSVYSGNPNNPESFISSIDETFNLKETDTNKLKLQFNYYDVEKELPDTFKVSFKVDKSSISTNKLEKSINKTITMGDSKIIIERLEATPSETKIIVKEVNNANTSETFNTSYLPELQLVYGNKIQTAYRSLVQGSKNNEFTYTFDPIDNFKDLKLIVNKAAVLTFCKEEINLINISGEKKKLQKIIDDIPFDMVYYRQNGDLKVEIFSTSADKGYLQRAEFDKDKSGKNIKTTVEMHDLSYKESRAIITGSEFKDDSISLYIKAYTKIINPNVEIDLGS